jgi:hypothetical protein
LPVSGNFLTTKFGHLPRPEGDNFDGVMLNYTARSLRTSQTIAAVLTRRECPMRLEDVTLALFAACNFIRIFAYLPQIYTAATDKNGASAISYTTWSLFLVAHLSTIAYAIVNRADWWLAACFACNALCCVAILMIAYWKSSCHARAELAPATAFHYGSDEAAPPAHI